MSQGYIRIVRWISNAIYINVTNYSGLLRWKLKCKVRYLGRNYKIVSTKKAIDIKTTKPPHVLIVCKMVNAVVSATFSSKKTNGIKTLDELGRKFSQKVANFAFWTMITKIWSNIRDFFKNNLRFICQRLRNHISLQISNMMKNKKYSKNFLAE